MGDGNNQKCANVKEYTETTKTFEKTFHVFPCRMQAECGKEMVIGGAKSPWQVQFGAVGGRKATARIIFTGEVSEWTCASYSIELDENEELFEGHIEPGRHPAAYDKRPQKSLTIRHIVPPYPPPFYAKVRVVERYAEVSPALAPENDEQKIAAFKVESPLTDCVLIVGESRLYVCKQYLAIHSLFFQKLFFGEFAEKGRSEVTLDQLDENEFIELLRVIHPERKKITMSNVSTLLKMADRFDVPSVTGECSHLLMVDKSLPLMEKLLLADQYRLIGLEQYCLGTIRDLHSMTALSRFGTHRYSERLRAILFDKLSIV